MDRASARRLVGVLLCSDAPLLLEGGLETALSIQDKVAIGLTVLKNNTDSKIKRRGVGGGSPWVTRWKKTKDGAYSRLNFAFRGMPYPTSGKTSRGYVKWLKTNKEVAKKGPMKADVMVWCSCPYFTYNLEFTLSKTVSPPASEIRKSNGNPPRVRNTLLIPHLCKHLVHAVKHVDSSMFAVADVDDEIQI
jgi:hypothetical protein